MSLRNRINNYLEDWFQVDQTKWINGGEIESLAQGAGYKASNASRRLRELENEGRVEKRYNHKGHVEYRHKAIVISYAPGYLQMMESQKQQSLI
jgi:hypothetical protein